MTFVFQAVPQKVLFKNNIIAIEQAPGTLPTQNSYVGPAGPFFKPVQPRNELVLPLLRDKASIGSAFAARSDEKRDIKNSRRQEDE
jgi:hypothetical protein